MRFYEAKDGKAGTITTATLDEAKEAAKALLEHSLYQDIVVDEVEVATDKANMVRLLNSDGGTHQYLRQWGMTPRGGFRLQDREES